jgi:hypothetical protein
METEGWISPQQSYRRCHWSSRLHSLEEHLSTGSSLEVLDSETASWLAAPAALAAGMRSSVVVVVAYQTYQLFDLEKHCLELCLTNH